MIIKQIYTYLILAVTLIMAMVGGITVISNSLSLTTFTGYLENYEDFVRNRCTNYNTPMNPIVISDPSAKPSAPTLTAPQCDFEKAISDTIWKERYTNYKTETMETERRQELERILKAIPLFFVPLPVFFYFERKRKDL